LRSKGASETRFALSTCTLYVNATADFGDIDEMSIVNSSGLSYETG
jgi:hypothetical protein